MGYINNSEYHRISTIQFNNEKKKMKKLAQGAAFILVLLSSHQTFASETQWIDGVQVEGEYLPAYAYSDTLYAYSYTIKPMDLHLISCAEETAEVCASYSGDKSPSFTINLLFSSKFGPNESPTGTGIDVNEIAQAHPYETMLPIPSIPLTLIGDGQILEDGSFAIAYDGRYGLRSVDAPFLADENGDIDSWNFSWGRLTQGTSTNVLDSIRDYKYFGILEGSSTDLSTWVVTPITRYQLQFNVFVPYQTSPVPEPESYAMFLSGLGLMGFVARRRQLGQKQKS
ncbi:protein of unknown function DUF1555 [Methylotenera versatilis 301]|uniref:Ice-binding protein C-terminal domain-containing protein n=2 Tax=Methylotenera TaxID=359407 RepID=D7DMR7_METV0|nr:protein of unknown function DUF1555 [Methylotenera versatilis 301]